MATYNLAITSAEPSVKTPGELERKQIRGGHLRPSFASSSEINPDVFLGYAEMCDAGAVRRFPERPPRAEAGLGYYRSRKYVCRLIADRHLALVSRISRIVARV